MSSPRYYQVEECTRCPYYKYKWFCELSSKSILKIAQKIPDWCELPHLVEEEGILGSK